MIVSPGLGGGLGFGLPFFGGGYGGYGYGGYGYGGGALVAPPLVGGVVAAPAFGIFDLAWTLLQFSVLAAGISFVFKALTGPRGGDDQDTL